MIFAKKPQKKFSPLMMAKNETCLPDQARFSGNQDKKSRVGWRGFFCVSVLPSDRCFGQPEIMKITETGCIHFSRVPGRKVIG